MSGHDPHRFHPVDPHGDPLTFALSGFLAEDPGSVREYALDSVVVDMGEELHLEGPVSGTVRLARTNRGIVVDGRFRAAILGECARCLRPLVTRVAPVIDEEVLPSIDLASGQPVPAEEGEDLETARLTDHHELELRPLLEAAISLEEPIAPLCSDDCLGLCTECGERLDDGHSHGDGPIDPRLEALRAFRFDADGESG